MNIRPTTPILALAMASLVWVQSPLAAQVSPSQAAVADATQSRDGDDDEKGSDALVPVLVGAGVVAGSVAAGAWGGEDAPTAAATPEEGTVYVPRATGSEGGPMLLTGDPATTGVTVPEPGMLGLLTMGALGLMGVIVFRRRHPAT